MPRNVKDVLVATLALFTPRKKWTQGSYSAAINTGDMKDEWNRKAEDTCYCLAGGLRVAIAPRTDGVAYAPCTDDTFGLYRNTLKALGFDAEHEAVVWNDRPSRTKRQVTDRIRKAIKEQSIAA